MLDDACRKTPVSIRVPYMLCATLAARCCVEDKAKCHVMEAHDSELSFLWPPP